MTFFNSPEGFNLQGRFYGVPVYLKMTDDDLVVQGTNRLFDWLLYAMTIFHNEVIERLAQMGAALFGYPYEPGFPFIVTYELQNEEGEN